MKRLKEKSIRPKIRAQVRRWDAKEIENKAEGSQPSALCIQRLTFTLQHSTSILSDNQLHGPLSPEGLLFF